ncbi:MAG TPA: DUF6600 domain-containing protein [Bryobacteraceae bacterium]|nr:DUF6600 domain-containing protein [Bryobacteraceae bacterium]
MLRHLRTSRPAGPAVVKRLSGLGVVALILLSGGCDFRFGSSARYLPAPERPDPSDPPSRVARLSYLEAPVSLLPAGAADWSAAVLNRPVTTGDELWVDGGARAELQLGFAVLRLDALTSFGFEALDDRIVQAKLTQGVLVVRLRRLDLGGLFEIDTPNSSITFSRAGEYRIDVHPESHGTEVIVRDGEAEVTSPTRAFRLEAGQQASLRGTGRLKHHTGEAPRPDTFEQFCQMRDRSLDRSESARYVAPDVAGYDDLDDGGIWLTDSTWGAYWTPRHVPPGWAPYRFGHWEWIEPWGWTWIDDAPWGFAPFHYGRWIHMQAGWGWIPGPPQVRPVYAPALVVFAGDGRSGSYLSSRAGSACVAWFPLGPGEVYVPAYHCSRRYLTNINVGNTVIERPVAIDQVDVARQNYANRSADAFTAVPREVFVKARPVGRSAIAVPARDAASAQVTGAAPPLAPTRESLSATPAAGLRVPKPPASAARETIQRVPPPPPPLKFEQKQPALEAQPGRPLDRETLERLRRNPD